MKRKYNEREMTEYKSIRYLNLFRLLLSFFFFSIIFNRFSSITGFIYNANLGKLIASIYLLFAIVFWVASVLYKKNSSTIGLLALAFDLPFIISLSLLLNGVDKGWAILPVITIGSFSILSRKPFAIIAMPIVAIFLLISMPIMLDVDLNGASSSTLMIYALTYIAVALVGIRQSQNYNQFLLLTQVQKKKIVNLSKINELVIDHIQSGIVAFNQDYKAILINKKAKELLKINEDSQLPKILIKKIIAIAGFKDSNSLSLFGEDIFINLTKLDDNSKLSLLFIEQQNLIDQKSQRANLVNLGQLSSTIAHELRNPLAAIYSASLLLNESEEISGEDKSITEIIAKQVERSNKIIEDILLMAKPHVANKTSINIFEKFNTFKTNYCQQRDINEDNVIIKINDNNLSIEFDTAHLSQLLWNLTENAIKHGADEKVTLVVNNQARSILIDFRNKGDKLEPIVEESLFTPFFTTHTQGTGLGLYICREMCRSNRAKLEYLYQDFQHIFRIHIQK